MARVHPTAIVSSEAELAGDAVVGPYCVLEGAVELGAGVELVSHVCVRGPMVIGAGTRVWPFACLGLPPQDFKFGPDAISAGVRIGEGCIIREYASVHAATDERTPTVVGDRVFLMCSSHVAHDASIGDDVVMVNFAAVAGHASVGTKATLSGQAMVHQFCRIGRLAFMSGGTGTSADVPPFCVVNERQRMGGVNMVGMRRAGMDRGEITAVRRAFREAIRTNPPRGEMLARLEELGRDSPAVAEMAAFVRTAKRPICPGRSKPTRLGVASTAGDGDE